MQVQKKYLSEWKKYTDNGDKVKLSKELGLSYPTIIKAFNGKASADLIVKIDEFFQNKKKKLKK